VLRECRLPGLPRFGLVAGHLAQVGDDRERSAAFVCQRVEVATEAWTVTILSCRDM